MSFKIVILCCVSIPCFAADNTANSWEEIGRSPYVSAFAIGLAMGGEWRMQGNIATQVSSTVITDEKGQQGALFVYSPKQRAIARERQRGLAIGFAQLVKHIVYPKMLFNFRSQVNSFSLVESALVPAMVYNATKEALDNAVPQAPQSARVATAYTSAVMVPYFFIKSGASLDRIIMQAFMAHVLGHQHNMWRHTPYLGQLTGSLSYASKVMPISQMIISRYKNTSSMLTVHPALGALGSVKPSADFVHGVVPVLVHAGVDLTFNAVAATPVGAAIEQGVDTVLDVAVKPLAEPLKKPVKRGAKKAMAEGVKIGTTVAIVSAAESQGCVIL